MHDTHHIKNIEYKTYRSKTLSKQMMETAPEKCFLQEIFSIYGVLFRARTAQADMENLFFASSKTVLKPTELKKRLLWNSKTSCFICSLNIVFRNWKIWRMFQILYIQRERKICWYHNKNTYISYCPYSLEAIWFTHNLLKRNTHGKTFQKSF